MPLMLLPHPATIPKLPLEAQTPVPPAAPKRNAWKAARRARTRRNREHLRVASIGGAALLLTGLVLYALLVS